MSGIAVFFPYDDKKPVFVGIWRDEGREIISSSKIFLGIHRGYSFAGFGCVIGHHFCEQLGF